MEANAGQAELRTADRVRAVEDAVLTRRAVRSFLPTPVDRALVRRILDVAARAPSGSNMQPWRVRVLAGAAKDRLCAALLAAHAAHDPSCVREHKYYPDQFFEPYLARRRKLGWDLYGLLGIARGDRGGAHAHRGHNLLFFGAPVGMIFTIDRRLELGSWLDYGCFLENIMILARAHGLDTCPQAMFAEFHPILRRELPLEEHEAVVCGMSLGHADPDAPVNRLTTERESADTFARFIGWDGPNE